MSIEAQGTLVFWSTSTAFSTAVSVGQVVSFSGPGGSAGTIDITHLQSTAKEKRMGLPDEGQFSFEVIYESTDTGQSNLRTDRAARNLRKFAVKFSNASSAIVHADAYCTGFSISGAVDDILKASVTLEVTGPLTWTTN